MSVAVHRHYRVAAPMPSVPVAIGYVSISTTRTTDSPIDRSIGELGIVNRRHAHANLPLLAPECEPRSSGGGAGSKGSVMLACYRHARQWLAMRGLIGILMVHDIPIESYEGLEAFGWCDCDAEHID